MTGWLLKNSETAGRGWRPKATCASEECVGFYVIMALSRRFLSNYIGISDLFRPNFLENQKSKYQLRGLGKRKDTFWRETRRKVRLTYILAQIFTDCNSIYVCIGPAQGQYKPPAHPPRPGPQPSLETRANVWLSGINIKPLWQTAAVPPAVGAEVAKSSASIRRKCGFRLPQCDCLHKKKLPMFLPKKNAV